MAYYGCGDAHKELHKYTEAIADYTTAIKINPQMTDAYRNRAHCYRELVLKEQNKERRHEYYKHTLDDHYVVVEHNPRDLAEYRVLFSTYDDFCKLSESDEEKKQLRKKLKPIVDRALDLVKARGNKLLEEQVQEYYDEYCEQPPHPHPPNSDDAHAPTA